LGKSLYLSIKVLFFGPLYLLCVSYVDLYFAINSSVVYHFADDTRSS